MNSNEDSGDNGKELEYWEVCLSQVNRQIVNLIEEGYDISDIRRALSWLLHELCWEE